MTQAQAHQVNVLKIFIFLIVLTVIEVGAASANLSQAALIGILLGSAVLKALLVAIYFMHLKFEGRLIWGMIIGAGILGIAFVLVLFPDIAIGYWK